MQQIGPFATPAPGTATVAASASTRVFDRDTTSSTGDPRLPGVVPGASAGTPLMIQPGATGNVGINILPTAPPDTTVRGVLYLVTPALGLPTFNTTGDVLAALPYAYTVR